MTHKPRCSSLDRVVECATSMQEPEAPHKPDNQLAREGTGHHLALKHVPLGTEPPVQEIADEFGMDSDDLEMMVNFAKKAWAEIAAEPWAVGELFTERRLEGVVSSGSTDVLQLMRNALTEETDAAAVYDWKTGWSDAGHPYQLMGYADAARATFGMPTSGYITGVELHLRLQTYNVHRFTEPQLDAFRARVTKQVGRIGKQVAAGPWCTWCPRAHECETRALYFRATAAAIVPVGEEGITREKLGELYPHAKQLTKVLAQYDKLLKGELDRGPVPIGDGSFVTWRTQERDNIITNKAWGVVIDELTGEQLNKVVKVGKTALMDAVVQNSVDAGMKRKGAPEKRRVLKALHEAGAIRKTVIKKKAIIKGELK